MKFAVLDDIIERDVDDSLYFRKDEWERRKYLKTTFHMMCEVRGDDVYLHKEDIRPPQILKLKRTDDEKKRRHFYGDSGKKFGLGMYVEPTGDGYSNTLTTFSTDNYVWDRNFKVRELTDREAFRLMDVDDDDVEKILKVIPSSRCKKLAGNSIVVNVMTEMFRTLFIDRPENKENRLW